MEGGEMKQRSFTGLYVLLTAVIVLQLISIFFGIMQLGATTSSTKVNTTENAKKSLPDNINKEYRKMLLSRFLEAWNNNDIQTLYDMMGKSAKSQLSFDKFKNQCEMFFSFGQVSETKYINYEYKGQYLGSDIINLYYTAKIGSQPGTLTFCLLNSEDEPQIMRFDIMANP